MLDFVKRYAYGIVIIGALVTLMTAGCSSEGLPKYARLKNNIIIDGVNVSGMNAIEADALLQKQAGLHLDGAMVTLLLPGKSDGVFISSLLEKTDTVSSVQTALRLSYKGGERVITSSLIPSKTAIAAFVTEYAKRESTSPVNASYQVDMQAAVPVAFNDAQSGIMVNQQALNDALYAAVSKGESCFLDVPYSAVEPTVTVAELQQTYCLISTYTTSFAKAPHNASDRVFNIRKAAAAVNGLILAPGETFDCNKTLGDRNEENGWKMAPAIRDGKYEAEYGGGVCQLSSTLFNAVMMADLKITQRHPHSWPMGYVDIGRDATISTGGKNFCFVNDSDADIQIFAYTDEKAETLTVSLYGKPLPDGTKIEIVSEKTGTLESAGETIMLDETLPYATRVVEREPRDGKTSVTYKEYLDRNGALLRREVAYEDTYRAVDGITFVSTDLFYS